MKNCFVLALVVFASAACGGSKSTTPSTPEPAAAEPAPAADAPATAAAEPEKPAEPPAAPEMKTAVAKLAPASKSKVTGTITFKQTADGVEATANIENLTPGEHAWHVHEKGDCSAPDATSAGGHFNPENHKHGAPDAAEHHAGDFGNLTAGKDGKATATLTIKGVTLDPSGATSLINKGFIVHEKKDDFKTQPTGNAGGRVACGVIQLEI